MSNASSEPQEGAKGKGQRAKFVSDSTVQSSSGPAIPAHLQSTVQISPETPPTPERPWGPIAAVLYSVLFYVAGMFGAAILIGVVLAMLGWNGERISSWLAESIAGQFWYVFLAEMAVIGCVIWFVRRRRVSLARIGWNRLKLQHLGMALLGFGVYFMSYIAVAIIARNLIPSLNLDQKQDIGFENAKAAKDLVLTGMSLVILPPLAEEILFRGFLYTGLRRAFTFWPAAIVTSLIFGAGHLQFGSAAPLLWVAGIDTFVLSMVLCYVRERTGSLWPGIFIHAIKNALAFSVLFLFK